MNFAPCLSTAHCLCCADEFAPEQLNEHGICRACSETARAELEAERIAACTCDDCGKVVASVDDLIDSANSGDYRCVACNEKHEYEMAELSDALDQAEYYGGDAPRLEIVVASPSLVKILEEAQCKARELLGKRFGAAS